MTKLPKISAICPTFARISHLEEAVHSFTFQNYAGAKELIIYNDYPGQHLVFDHPEVRIVNRLDRAPTLGDARNRCTAAATGDICMLWDDDDVWLPNFLTQLAKHMEGHDYVRFATVFHAENFEIKNVTSTAAHWIGYTRKAWLQVGGYPQMNAGEDREFIRRLEAAQLKGKIVENLPTDIQFIYQWGNGVYHASGGGDDKPGQPTLFQRMGDHVEREARGGKIPLGRIELKPRWRKDWVKHARDFLVSRGFRFPEPVTATLTPEPVWTPPAKLPTPPRPGTAPKLSMVINCLNDAEELNLTVKSIRETAGDAPEIIVIDDGSDVPLVVDDPKVILRRTPHRVGCGATRHYGATLASGRWLIFTDSHMRFEPGWYETAIARLEAKPETIYCATCLGMEEGQMDMILEPRNVPSLEVPLGRVVSWNFKRVIKEGPTTYKNVDGKESYEIGQHEIVGRIQLPVYAGAKLNLAGPDPNNPKLHQVFEGVWYTHDQDDCEIPCLMGASYFINREVFFRLNGLRQLRMWGSDEPYLSLKAWLAGYEIRMLRTVRIGHKFRTAIPGTNPPRYHAPYATQPWYGLYNKVRVMRTILSEEEASYLTCLLVKGYAKGDVDHVMKLLDEEWVDVVATKHAYSELFVHDLRWYCDRFQIRYPLDPELPVNHVAQPKPAVNLDAIPERWRYLVGK